MAQQGDRYVVELKEPHLQWGEYRYTDTRETVKDEGYIPIPLNDARRLELVNSNATGGKDILGKNLFRYTTCDGYCKGFLKAQGSSVGGSQYAKQLVPSHPVLDMELNLVAGLDNYESVTLSLVTRNGSPGNRSGLNWGQRLNRDRNEAYIPLPRVVASNGFFPPSYADSHRGFVVTYDFHSVDTYLCGKDGICKNCPTIQTPPNIYPVYYSNEKYDASRYAIAALLKVSMASSGVSIPQGLLRAADASMIWEIERISLLKKPCHVFDEEWRMIYSQWCVARPCIKLKPKSVIIGYRTPLYKERLIISAATVAGIKDVRKIQINRKDELEAVPIQIKN